MTVFTAQKWNLEKSKPEVEGGLLSQAQACAYLGISQRTIYDFVAEKRLPVVRFQEKGKPRYRRVDLDQFIESCVQGNPVNFQGTGGCENE